MIPRAAGASIPNCPRRSKRWKTIPIAPWPGNCADLGGFAKDLTPFSEFLWADFLRPRIKAKAIKADFAAALTEALTLAKTGEADYLPGWCGPRHSPPQPSGKAKNKDAKRGGGERAASSSARP